MMEFDDLNRAIEASASSGRTVHVFFRDDDADDDIPNFHRLLDIFHERHAPINLEVIPGTLTSRGADSLLRRWNQAGGLIELNQHGWIHANHETEGRKHEFGPSRNYEQQFLDIQRGRDVLNDVFGSAWRPVFTPPWNRCTRDTLRVLDELGFAVLSRDTSELSTTGYGFREISITLDIFSWKNGATLKASTNINECLTSQVRAGGLIGILLHHKVMTPEAFGTVDRLLETLTRSEAIRIHTFESVLKLVAEKEAQACMA